MNSSFSEISRTNIDFFQNNANNSHLFPNIPSNRPSKTLDSKNLNEISFNNALIKKENEAKHLKNQYRSSEADVNACLIKKTMELSSKNFFCTERKPPNDLLDLYLRKEDSTVIHTVKSFINKLKIAASLRSIKQLKSSHLPFFLDPTFYYSSLEKQRSSILQADISRFANKIKGKIKRIFKGTLITSILLRTKAFAHNPKFIFHPYKNFKIFWDLFHLLLIMFLFFYLPVLFAFEEAVVYESFINGLSFLFFFLDILVNFNTSYFKSGFEERSRVKIIKNYLNTCWHSELFAIFPFFIHLVVSEFVERENESAHSHYYALHLLNFLFYLKVSNFKKIIHRITERFLLKEKMQNVLSLAKVFFVSILVAHIFACFWYLAGTATINQHSWITQLKLNTSKPTTKYLYSIYWAFITMMTVGYGDIAPQNELEIIVCLVTVVLGCAVYAYNINSIGMILQEINKESDEFHHNINIINQFMKRKNINKHLQMRVREYLRFIWKEEKLQNLFEEQKIIGFLSVPLKEELLMEAYGGILMKFPLFYTNFTEKCLRKVANIFHDHKLFPQEKIFQENELDDCSIYFIMKGKVDLFTESGVLIKELGVGDHFGEIAFFSGEPRKLSARSKDLTTLFSINRDEFISVLMNFNDDFEQFCMIKDQIRFYNTYKPLRIRCFACNQIGHIVKNCPLVHFTPDNEKIIKRYNFYDDQERNNIFTRKNLRGFNALDKKNLVVSSSKKIKDWLQNEKMALLTLYDRELSDNSSEETVEEEVEDKSESLEEISEKNINFRTNSEVFTTETNNNVDPSPINASSNKNISQKQYYKTSSHFLTKTNEFHKMESEKLVENTINSNNNEAKLENLVVESKNENTEYFAFPSIPEKEVSRLLTPHLMSNIKKTLINSNSESPLFHVNQNAQNVKYKSFTDIESKTNIEKIPLKEESMKKSNKNKEKINSQTTIFHLNKNLNEPQKSYETMMHKDVHFHSMAPHSPKNETHLLHSFSKHEDRGGILDQFEIVAHMKNYYPEYNSSAIFEHINVNGAKYNRGLQEKNKLLEKYLTKYTFFFQTLKKRMPKHLKRRSKKMKNKKEILNFSKTNSLKKTSRELSSSTFKKHNEISPHPKFSDVVLHVMRNPSIKKKLKK